MVLEYSFSLFDAHWYKKIKKLHKQIGTFMVLPVQREFNHQYITNLHNVWYK